MSPYSRNGQQITFVLFLTDNIDRDGQNTNQNQMKNTFPFYTVFQVLKVLLGKICNIQLPDHFIVFISFYISRYHFSQIFRTSFNIICLKKMFLS